MVRPVAVDGENGGEFNLIADDQYSIRQNKIGYFGSLEEGRVVLDDRALIGTVIKTADDQLKKLSQLFKSHSISEWLFFEKIKFSVIYSMAKKKKKVLT